MEENLKPRVAKMNRALSIDEEIETLETKVRELWGLRTSKHEQKVINERELERHLAKV